MIGPEGFVEVVKAFLEDRIPAKVLELETRLELDAGTIPPPALVATEDRPQLAIEDWPAYMLVPVGDENLGRVDLVEASEVYRVRYDLRIYIYCRAEGFPEVSALLRRHVLAVRETLLEALSLGRDDALVNPRSIRGRYSDVELDDAGRSIAAAFIEVSVTIEETVTVAGLGEATSHALTGHPAL